MTIFKTPGRLRLVAAFGLLVLGGLLAAEPEAPKEATLTVIDSAGKEHKLKAWKITAGLRPLAWLAPAEKKEPEPDKKEPDKKEPPIKVKPRLTGPEALAFREEESTNFVEGILTLIPLERIRSIDYDLEAKSVSVTITGADKEEDIVLKGTTRFGGINKLAIEAEVDKGDLGVAEIKFQGGVAKGGIRAVRFPAPKAAAAAQAGRAATISTNDKKDKGPFKVTDVQALYRMADGTEKLMPVIYFKKSLKVELAKLEKMSLAEGSKEGTEWVVKFKDGEEHTLTLLPSLPDEKQVQLEALVGRVPAGYRLFPIGLISELAFEETKKE